MNWSRGRARSAGHEHGERPRGSRSLSESRHRADHGEGCRACGHELALLASAPGMAEGLILGVWEDGQFAGVVLLSRGSNNHLGSPYGLTQTEVCELTRVALREHKAPVSQIVARVPATASRPQAPACGWLSRSLIPDRAITAASTRPATGSTRASRNRPGSSGSTAARSTSARCQCRWASPSGPASIGHCPATSNGSGPTWTRKAEEVMVRGKHRYLYPLDRAMRRLHRDRSAKPYPAAEVSTVTRHASGEESTRCNPSSDRPRFPETHSHARSAGVSHAPPPDHRDPGT